MGSTYFPPKKGTDPTPQVGQAPASDRLDGPDATSAEALQALFDNSDLAKAFINAQRQNVANSQTDYHAAELSSPDLDVRYVNHRGNETIRLSPRGARSVGLELEQLASELPGFPIPELVSPTSAPRAHCLMVLFKTNGIAAFPMGQLSPKGCGSPDFVGTSRGSAWISGNPTIQVGQYTLAGNSYILTQLDLSGGPANSNLTLSTTKLTDAVATQASVLSLPVMNSAVHAGVYTVGGAFGIEPVTKAFVQTASMMVDGTGGNVPVAPIAIAADGTSYFFPTLRGSFVGVLLDPKSMLSYSFSNSFESQASVIEQAALGKLPNPNVYPVEYIEHNVITGGGSPGAWVPVDTRDIFTDDTTATGYIVGVSYYGRAPFGQIPAPQSVQVGQSSKEIEVFDIGLNHTVIQSTPVPPTGVGFGNDLYLQTYFLRDGTVQPMPFSITAEGFASNHPLVLNTDPALFANALALTDHLAIAVPNDYPAPGYKTEVEAAAASFPGVIYPSDPPFLDQDYPAVRTFFETWLALTEASPRVTGHVTLDGLDPTSLSLRYGSHSSTFTSNNRVNAFNQEMDYFFIQTPAFTTPLFPGPPSMTLHAHPPALARPNQDPLPYWTLTRPAEGSGGEDATAYTVGTPYAQHAALAADSFTPWLHVSNGAHCIQGYLVDGAPHAFVDGSAATGFLDAIASQCKCDVTEIVAMYMDITLDKVKAVANVLAPNYS